MKKMLIAVLTLLLTAMLLTTTATAQVEVVSIPDANLAAAIREALGLPTDAVITADAMLDLTELMAGGKGITALTGLEYATNLTRLGLGWTAVSDVSPLANLTQLTWLHLSGPGVSDVSPLAGLTQLTELGLGGPGVSDVSLLAGLTQLTYLFLSSTAVSDVSPLANLTQLTLLSLDRTGVSDAFPLAGLTQLISLSLSSTAVSDVSPLANLTQLKTLNLHECPLSYASIHTHIPALQAKGIVVDVDFDNVAHPALLRTSGDGQEGAPGATLKTAFVVETMDEHGKPIVGKTVGFDILAGGGTLSAQTAATDAQGKAQVTLTLGRASGINKVKASSESIRSWVLFTAVATE